MTPSPSNGYGIAILGGSFDPVHLGHLWMAEAALEQLPVGEVRLIPTATSPLKPDGPTATNEQRLKMLRLALGGAESLLVDSWEIEQEEISYTLTTLKHLATSFPKRQLFLVVGADSLASFDRWHEPTEILQYCTLSVIPRGAHEPPDYSILESLATAQQLKEIRNAEIKMPQIEISSSDLRKRVQSGRSIRFRVPHPVAAMIHNDSIYKD